MLAYRVILFWLPLIVGAVAFVLLRRALDQPSGPTSASPFRSSDARGDCRGLGGDARPHRRAACVDLFVSGRRPHAVGFREAVAWSVFYISIAVIFGVVFGVLAGWDFGSQYFAGYIVEKSLSVDNLFVFVIIMTTFAVPAEHQQRVLTFGILAALILRAIFIALGAALLDASRSCSCCSGCC